MPLLFPEKMWSSLVEIRCSAGSTPTTAVTNADPSSSSTDPMPWEDLEAVIERDLIKKEEDLVTLRFPSAATTTADVVRPRLGQNASFGCKLPVGGRPTDLHWTVQGRPVVQRAPPVAHHPHYEFAQWIANDTVALLRMVNVSLASSGEVVCHLRETVLRRCTLLLPRVTRAAEIFETPWAPQQRVAVGGQFGD
ncbi:uncharacterized protein LOC129593201 isoform X2 [Paramacrobiotus metropolitanus]|uniref:uncharacterized protein LOC129593201 isoform X2 n=1 Tax=Paramacrobiotus metropolitanus TaxID=2943436 RepID=UPI00244598D2|nr:uncharacterized protein LOC129593201 isoform X2 [Paramacrobiotus metropolitanus]